MLDVFKTTIIMLDDFETLFNVYRDIGISTRKYIRLYAPSETIFGIWAHYWIYGYILGFVDTCRRMLILMVQC